MTGTGRQQWSFPLSDATRDSSLGILWARKRLEHLYVFPNASKDSRAEILALGLKYSLLTSATSFIGVDETLPTGDARRGHRCETAAAAARRGQQCRGG